MAAGIRHIPALLEIHADELAYLWGQRRAALASPRYTLREFLELNERIEAHTQGLLAVPAALPELLMPRLAEGDRDGVFAAAYALLRSADGEIGARLVQVFAAAAGPRLAGLRDAFAVAPARGGLGAMRELLAAPAAPVAVAAAVVLANHGALAADDGHLAALLTDAAPEVCRTAWQVAALVDGRQPDGRPPRAYREALAHDSADVRHAALLAASWGGREGTLAAVRQLAADGDGVALRWLAALGDGGDWPLFGELAAHTAQVGERCALLARFGHPGVLDTLLPWLAADELALAAAAGAAFTRVTGVDIRSGERRQLEAPAGDAWAVEFAPLVWLPDVRKAEEYLARQRQSLAAAAKWNRGIGLGAACALDALQGVDLEVRWDVCARAACGGRPIAPPPPVH